MKSFGKEIEFDLEMHLSSPRAEGLNRCNSSNFALWSKQATEIGWWSKSYLWQWKAFFQILHKIILLLFFASYLVTTQQNSEHSNVRTISVNWDFETVNRAVVGLGASQRFSFWPFPIFGLFEHRSHKIDPQWIIDRQSKALHTLGSLLTPTVPNKRRVALYYLVSGGNVCPYSYLLRTASTAISDGGCQRFPKHIIVHFVFWWNLVPVEAI